MTQRFYTIRAKADRSAEVLIYGDIGDSWWSEGVTAKDFVREIAALDVDKLTVRINSAGGSVPDGIAIYNAIKRHKAHVTTINDSLAASAASLILMAGDTVQMAENALLMIHAPWGMASGNSADMREFADMLDTWAQAMSSSYAHKSGKDAAAALALLTDGKDHWYGVEEAMAEGFVDESTPALALAASIDRTAVAARFQSHPRPGANIAAAAVQLAQQERLMPPMSSENTPAATQPAAIQEADIRASALAADAQRRREIKALAAGHIATVPGINDVLAAAADDVTCSLQDAHQRVLAHMAKGAQPVAGSVVIVDDEHDKFRRSVSAALQIRAGLAKNDTANPLRGHTLYEMARASLERSGVKTSHMDKMGVVASAFTRSTSDFSNLLADVANKAMLKGYEEAEETFQKWTSVGTLPDFKPGKRVDLNTFPALDQVAEGAEYKYGTVGDRGETIQLATYGKLFSITRQSIVNDDLDAFTKIPRKMGAAAVRTVGNLVYAVLTGNPNMADGVALFHATHNNLPTAAAISTASVDAMMAAMRKQTDGTSTLNIRMAYLLCPVALEGTALTVANSEFEVGASSKNNTTPNYVRGRFQVISDARLDAASTSVWYGAANAQTFDTIEVAYLDGNQAPTLEQENGWSVDGVQMKVRLDAGVKALDFRTLAKNAGA